MSELDEERIAALRVANLLGCSPEQALAFVRGLEETIRPMIAAAVSEALEAEGSVTDPKQPPKQMSDRRKGQRYRWHRYRLMADGSRYICMAWGCTFTTPTESVAKWHEGMFAGVEVARPPTRRAPFKPTVRKIA